MYAGVYRPCTSSSQSFYHFSLRRFLRIKSTLPCTCLCISLDTSISIDYAQTRELLCLEDTWSKHECVLASVILWILSFCSIFAPICSNLTSFAPTIYIYIYILALIHKRHIVGTRSTLNMPKDKLSAIYSNWKNKYN